MKFELSRNLLTAERVSGYYANGAWSTETVADLLRDRAARDPRGIALTDEAQHLTWAELLYSSHRVAAGFRRLGLGRGDAAVLQLPNWWEHVVAYYALHLAGCIVIQIGADWRSSEVEYGLTVGNPKVAIVPANFRAFDFPAMYRAIDPNLSLVVVRGDDGNSATSFADLMAAPAPVTDTTDQADMLGPDEISRVVFTSGTTDRPKAILHTTNTTRFSSRIIAQAYGISSDDVALSYLPLTTNAGAVWTLYLPLETGTATALLDRFSAQRALSVVEINRATLFCGSPTALIAMSQRCDPPLSGPSTLRLLISSGSSCPPQAIPQIRSGLRASFVEVYGMNELGWATTTKIDDDPTEVDGTIGRPYPYVESKVVTDDGSEVPPGKLGELLLRSPGTCLGYHANPATSAATWDADGWTRTGDNATVDPARNITLVSRKKDLIIRGGANVSPREVEEATREHPSVHDVTVIGIPDETYGESVAAFVMLKPSHSLQLQELRQFLLPRIAFYKIPSQLEIVDDFPVTSSGKVKRHVLRDRVLDAQSAGVAIESRSNM